MDMATGVQVVIDTLAQKSPMAVRLVGQPDDFEVIEDSVRILGVTVPQETVAYFDIEYGEDGRPFAELRYITVEVKGVKIRFSPQEITDEELAFIGDRLAEWMEEYK